VTDPIFELPFYGGMDEATRDELVEPGAAFTVLENGRYRYRGGLGKRLGYTSLASTLLDATSRAAGYRMLMNGDHPCVVNGTNLHAYSTAAARWIDKGRVPEATYRHREAPTLGAACEMEDVVYCNGYVALAYLVTTDSSMDSAADWDPAYAFATVIDATSGAVVRSPENVDATLIDAQNVMLATYGNYLMMVVARSNASGVSDVEAYYLDTTSAATLTTGWVSIGTIVSADYNGSIDVVSVPTLNTRIAVAYPDANDDVKVKTVSIAGVLETVTISVSPSAAGYIGLSEGGTALWVCWSQGSDIKACALDPADIDGTPLGTTATVLSPGSPSGVGFSIMVAPRDTASTDAAVFVGSEDLPFRTYTRAIQITAGAAATDGSAAEIMNAKIHGRPILRGGRLYAPFSSDLDAELILCDCTPDTTGASGLVTYLRPVAAPIQRELFAPPVAQTTYVRSRIAAIDSTKYVHAFMVRKSGSTNGTALVEYDFASAYRWKPAVLNGSTFLSGGVTSIFDGVRVFEAGFLVRPRILAVNVSGGTGTTFTLGGRSYVAVYEEIDADGNWHVSGTSAPLGTGNITDKQVLVRVIPLSITSRGSALGSTGSSLRIALYATEDGAEEPYYRLTELPNDPTQEYMQFEDTVSDSALSDNALLYGTGNLPGTGASQDHRAPAGLLYHVSYNGMLVGATGSNVYFSAQPIDGEGTWFSPVFVRSVDAEVTGLAVQDGAVLIFTRSGCWITSGEPPSDNGFQGGLSTPRKLSVEQGCTNANSIVTTSLGTFYQSVRGIELLTRSQSNVFVGDKVQDTLASYPVVTSAVLDEKEGLVRISLATAQTAGLAATNGVDLVFDLTLGVWLKDVKRGGVATQATQDALIAYVASAWRYCWLATDGAVYYERATGEGSDCLDGSTWITKKAVTSWIHLAGLQGEQFVDQVLMLAKHVTGHELTISIAFDYVESFTETKTFTAAQVAALAREWLVWGVNRTKHSAIKVQLVDATPTSGSVGTGEGATWVCLTLNGQPHRGPRRSPSTARGGS
jgi:hypothetical protein